MLTNPRTFENKPSFDIDNLEWFKYEEESVGENIATITFDYPEKANALNLRNRVELNDILDYVTNRYIGENPVEVVILTGAEDWFCSGAEMDREGTEFFMDGEYFDKAEFFQEENIENSKIYFAYERLIMDMMMKILRMPQIVIGAVNGPATGLGNEIQTATDISIAHSEKAVFGVNETVMGITPINMGLFKKRMGPTQAKRFMLRGPHSFPNYMDAKEAKATGLVDEVVPGDEFKSRVQNVALDIASMSAEQCRLIKETMNLDLIEDFERTGTRQLLLQTTLRGRKWQRDQSEKLTKHYSGSGDMSKSE